jgi:hypothetical protein
LNQSAWLAVGLTTAPSYQPNDALRFQVLVNAAGRHLVQRHVPHLSALAVIVQMLNPTPLHAAYSRPNPWYKRAAKLPGHALAS